MLCHTQLCTQLEVKKDVVNGRIMMVGCDVEVNMGGGGGGKTWWEIYIKNEK